MAEMKRDPRMDPQAGDVVLPVIPSHGPVLVVHFRQVRTEVAIYYASMGCSYVRWTDLIGWRRLMEGAKVIHAE